MLYWNTSQCVASHKLWKCHEECYYTTVVTHKIEALTKLHRIYVNNRTQILGKMYANAKQTDILGMLYANDTKQTKYLGRVYAHIGNQTKSIGRMYAYANKRSKLLDSHIVKQNQLLYSLSMNDDFRTRSLDMMHVKLKNQTKIFFLKVPSLQGPLIHKWRRKWSRTYYK